LREREREREREERVAPDSLRSIALLTLFL
jgi:hypothetical protein